jgi:hypothetical protein
MDYPLCKTSRSAPQQAKRVTYEFCCGCGRQLSLRTEVRGLARALCWWCRSELAPSAAASLEFGPGVAQRDGSVENELAGL